MTATTSAAPALFTGDHAILSTPTHWMPKAFRGRRVHITRTDHNDTCPLCAFDVLRDDGSVEMSCKDIPLAYLSPLPIGAPVTPSCPVQVRSTRTPTLRMTSPPDKRKEEKRQAEVVSYLSTLTPRYIVHEIGGKRRGLTCQCCGSYVPPSGSVGNTPGASDLQISRSDYPEGVWMALEMKDTHQPSALTQEQRELRALGRIYVAWNLPTAIEAVYAFEDSDPRITVHPALVEWMASHGRLAVEGKES